VVRPATHIEAIPATTPFVGPEQLMRETGQSDLVRLGANESAFGPSPNAIAAMSAELERLSWYGDPESLDLRDALALKHDCRPSQIVVGAGIDDLMGIAVRGFLPAGGVALTSRGTYPTFNYHVTGYAGILAFAGYRDDCKPDLDALAAMAHDRNASIVYLANPDNPSGSFYGRDDIARFRAALPHDALFMLDEAYADFVEPDELMPMEFDDSTIRLRTFSKAYGMAGARIGYALLTENHAATFQKIRLHYGINRNAQIGALASLSDDAFRERIVRATEEAREDYYALARDLGCDYIESRTNFVCIDMGTRERAERVVDELLKRGVWIRKPGAPPLDRFIRVSAGTEPMRAAFARALRAVLHEVPA
jgi:histidinol-phosphate aminotransferase